MTSLNAPEEVALAKELLKLHPWAGMVRFARMGGEAMAVAVRIARAKSGKSKIAFCGYHGWHDWYLSTNLASAANLDAHHLSGLSTKGVPEGLTETALPFRYNHFEELEQIVSRHDIGVIVMEPMRHHEPENDFLKKVRDLATARGIVLVYDEITSGFRTDIGGMHKRFGVIPDIAVFAKGIGNGFPISAIVGKKEVMDVAQETFVSSTHWTERVGYVAALATIAKMKKERVPQHLDRMGRLIAKGWEALSKKHDVRITILGPMPLVTFLWDYKGKELLLKTIFTQEMLKRGFLASQSVYLSLSHKEQHIKKYLAAVDEVFALIAEAERASTLEDLLEGPIAHAGFARLT
jgi:glutamate-1-semialdehyde aminotransferase